MQIVYYNVIRLIMHTAYIVSILKYPVYVLPGGNFFCLSSLSLHLSPSMPYKGFSISGGNSRVPPCSICLRMVACGDRKDFFAVHTHVAFPAEKTTCV